jgi:zona occludens toxin
MPFSLITGLPGAGKTLFTVSRVGQQFPNRPVRYIGIDGLDEKKLGWRSMTEDELHDWVSLPTGTVIVIDECHKYFPVRGNTGRPPAWIEKLTEHRHYGLDFVFVTQHPMNFDHFIRRLVQTHFHLKRIFGSQKAALLRGNEYVDVTDKWAVKAMEKGVFIYPKDFFGSYHSADSHTVTRRVPPRLFVYLGVVALVIGLIWWVSGRLTAKPVHKVAGPVAGASAVVGGSGLQAGGYVQAGVPIAGSWGYVERAKFIPRDPQFPESAVAYDKVRPQVVAAPKVQGCFLQGDVCRCYDQQAALVVLEHSVCVDHLVRRFDAYRADKVYAASGPYGADVKLPEASVTAPGLLGQAGGMLSQVLGPNTGAQQQ